MGVKEIAVNYSCNMPRGRPAAETFSARTKHRAYSKENITLLIFPGPNRHYQFYQITGFDTQKALSYLKCFRLEPSHHFNYGVPKQIDTIFRR